MLADIARRQSMPSAGAALQGSIVCNRFDVGELPVHQQLLAWRGRMGMVIDVVLSRDMTRLPFRAAVDRYDIGEYVFSESYTDQITLDRSIARISRDNARSIVFHVFLGGRRTVSSSIPPGGKGRPSTSASWRSISINPCVSGGATAGT
ncbi:hypothetical protein [Cupriavidus sp. D39]|uniref:hypothetical protein n=1 Tax=Cupriavidus sp. D39 TaxID=2997877 RepID=UPI00226F0033|nr:hypothetical protein [Cupriavidus sp. D39]MCY0854915.1 hypothetical protein [Cupriavidus sp. D39]